MARAPVPPGEPKPPALALGSSPDTWLEGPTPSMVRMPLALAVNDKPPGQPGLKRDAAPRVVRREAVTQTEALEAAQRAVPSLRGCTGAPRHVTVDLEIVRGRGVVTALNLRPVDLDDPNSWHGCAVQSLKPVRFPVSERASPVQIRLSLR